SNYILDTEKKNNAPADFIKKALKHAIPTPIYDALAPFFDGQGLYDAYGVLLRAKASIDRNIRLEEHVERYSTPFITSLGCIRRARYVSHSKACYTPRGSDCLQK